MQSTDNQIKILNELLQELENAGLLPKDLTETEKKTAIQKVMQDLKFHQMAVPENPNESAKAFFGGLLLTQCKIDQLPLNQHPQLNFVKNPHFNLVTFLTSPADHNTQELLLKLKPFPVLKLDKDLKKTHEQIKELKQEINKIKSEINTLKNNPTPENIKKIEALNQKLQMLSQKLDNCVKLVVSIKKTIDSIEKKDPETTEDLEKMPKLSMPVSASPSVTRLFLDAVTIAIVDLFGKDTRNNTYDQTASGISLGVAGNPFGVADPKKEFTASERPIDTFDKTPEPTTQKNWPPRLEMDPSKKKD